MGYSNYVHLDFEKILKESDHSFTILLSHNGAIIKVPKKYVAYRHDYHKGDSNGVISIHDDYAAQLGYENY